MRNVTTGEERERRFAQACSHLTEFFKDFLVICRLPSAGLMWRSSDPTWARGAVKRYATRLDQVDVCESADRHYEEQRGGDQDG